MSTLNDDKATYYSGWDIDQLEVQGEVDNILLPASVFSTTYLLLKSLPSFTYPPIIDGVWQATGEDMWRQFGDATASAYWINAPLLLTVTSAGVFLAYSNFNASPASINIRYYVWTDKVTY